MRTVTQQGETEEKSRQEKDREKEKEVEIGNYFAFFFAPGILRALLIFFSFTVVITWGEHVCSGFPFYFRTALIS